MMMDELLNGRELLSALKRGYAAKRSRDDMSATFESLADRDAQRSHLAVPGQGRLSESWNVSRPTPQAVSPRASQSYTTQSTATLPRVHRPQANRMLHTQHIPFIDDDDHCTALAHCQPSSSTFVKGFKSVSSSSCQSSVSARAPQATHPNPEHDQLPEQPPPLPPLHLSDDRLSELLPSRHWHHPQEYMNSAMARNGHHHSLPRQSHSLALSSTHQPSVTTPSAVWSRHNDSHAPAQSGLYVTRIPIYPNNCSSASVLPVSTNAKFALANPTGYYYEMSDDFREKQYEVLARKYGGHGRMHQAASTIQRAYREYNMMKRWQQVRTNPAQRRPRVTVPMLNTNTNAANEHVIVNGDGRCDSAASSSTSLSGQGSGLPYTRRQSPLPQMNRVNTAPVAGHPLHGNNQSAPVLRLHRCYGTPSSLTAQLRSEQTTMCTGAGTGSARRSQSSERVSAGTTSSTPCSSVDYGHHSQSYASYAVVQSPDELTLASTPLGRSAPVRRQRYAQQTQDLSSADSTCSSGLGSSLQPSPGSPGSSVVSSLSPSTNGSAVWLPYTSAAEQRSSRPPLPVRQQSQAQSQAHPAAPRHTLSDKERRLYRVALNFFNKKPERGMQLLVQFGFVSSSAVTVARFLSQRRGLSKQMIGEYLGIYHPFNVQVLEHFAQGIDLRGNCVDEALRVFLAAFRLPGEAQKIDRIMQAFATRYCVCNSEQVSSFVCTDTVFVLAFAIVMLNTDLHSPNIRNDRRMKCADFIKNLRGIDGGQDVCAELLTGIYERVRASEFHPGEDHVTQVLKVDKSILGLKKPTLALPHRRLVCYCRLQEVNEPNKRQPPTAHHREIFLFNDLIMITKVLNKGNKKKQGSSATYTYRQSHSLVGMQVQAYKTQYYQNGIRMHLTLDNKVLYFNASNEDDRNKFLEDLEESVKESDEMEQLRIELELEKQSLLRCAPLNRHKHSLGTSSVVDSGTVTADTPVMDNTQRDSGLCEDNGTGTGDNYATLRPAHTSNRSSGTLLAVATTAPSTSTAAVHSHRHAGAGAGGAGADPQARRASVNSFDSGRASSTASIDSRDASPKSSTAVTVTTPIVEEPSTPKLSSARHSTD